MLALQDLGERLTALSRERLARLDLPETLLGAILEAKRLEGKHEARRRQMQYVGRLMRDVDAAGIAQRLAGLEGDSPQAKARRAQLERLRERFLEDERVLGEILAWAPQADVQHLRALRRKVLEERQKGEPTGESYRALYRELKVLFEAREAEGRLGFGRRRRGRGMKAEAVIGLVSVSDRASQGVYEDRGLPALEAWLSRALVSPWRAEKRLIPDERPVIERTLIELATSSAAASSSPPAGRVRPRATSRPRRRSPWVRRSCPALAKRCGASACVSSPPPSCRARWR